MAHPKGRKQSTRLKILDAAAALFRAKGYEATTIAEIMLACGLTQGGFYAHFSSKAHLYGEAVGNAQTYGPVAQAGRGAGGDWLNELLATCDPSRAGEANCGWLFLARDVANSSAEVRKGYGEAVRVVRDMLESCMSEQRSHRNALAATATLVGAIAISQTVDDADFRASIADACRSAVQSLCDDEPLSFFWMPERAEAGSLSSRH